MALRLELRPCPDCAVNVGSAHLDGCDVARCTECGWQRIGCDHEDSDLGWGAIWTGQWPGDAECVEFGLFQPNGDPDLNELAIRSARGQYVWSTDRQCWVTP